ncbi:MAG TPA: hypothetical protein VKE29_04935, partial [Candidatus Udaeobacter sp.]|nr:hypothetical protein [Candidatus Udaeobacter sp.]
RVSVYVGLLASGFSVVALIAIVIDKLWITRNVTLGIPTVLASIVFFAGLELMILGLVGEYLGRLYLDHTGTPQYVVRYTVQAGCKTESFAAVAINGEDRSERNAAAFK